MGKIGETVAGAGLGLLLGGYNDQRQYEQQRKLQGLQIAGQKQLGMFNQGLAKEMWDYTNYENQRRHMENAGLNVGLMYGSAGAGGSTSGGSAGSVTGGNAPVGGGEVGMAMQLGLQKALTEAQIENVKADTEKKKVEAGKTGGVDTQKIGAEIQSILQATQNAELQGKIMEYDKQLRAIQTNVAGLTQDEIIKQIQTATQKLIEETRSAKAKGNIDEATQNNVIKGAELANQATAAGITATQTATQASKVGMEATKAGQAKTEQETKNLQQIEITNMLNNAMKANGIEPGDNTIVRMLNRWMGENKIDMSTLQKKMSRLMAWLKGENGAQTWDRLEEIMQ